MSQHQRIRCCDGEGDLIIGSAGISKNILFYFHKTKREKREEKILKRQGQAMKQKFKKITAATAALVLTCGCVMSGLYRSSTAVSFAESSGVKYTGTVDEKYQMVYYAGNNAPYTVMSSLKSDDRPETFVVPAFCMYGEPVDKFDKDDQRLRRIFALGFKSVKSMSRIAPYSSMK